MSCPRHSAPPWLPPHFRRYDATLTPGGAALTRTPTSFPADRLRAIALAGGPVAGAALWLALRATGLPTDAALVAGLTVWVACWWLFEPVPIPLTSLLPFAILPAAGILTPDQVGAAYGNPLILLMLGGFMLSQALSRSGVHRRLAIGMLRIAGGRNGRSLVFGFMLASASLSLWISNSATCLMLLPIALAVIEQTTPAVATDSLAVRRHRRLTFGVLLGTAYGANIGGMGTPIGTPPNLVFMEVYRRTTGITPGFLDYMTWALPIVILLLPLVALWLARGLGRGEPVPLPSSGRWRTEERRVLSIFVLVALAWVTRTEPFGGWSAWLGVPGASDASVALLGCVLMALVPDGRTGPDAGRLLDWDHAARIPWGVLLLFGSGIAIAAAFETSGLSRLVGSGLAESVRQMPLVLVVVAICAIVTFLTEVTSNTAVATLLMPILAALAIATDMDPRLIMLAGSLSTSCAFMLPVATPPNAIVFGAGRLSVADMAREGLVVNLIGVAVVSLVLLGWVRYV